MTCPADLSVFAPDRHYPAHREPFLHPAGVGGQAGRQFNARLRR